jgi:hypothetical protein
LRPTPESSIAWATTGMSISTSFRVGSSRALHCANETMATSFIGPPSASDVLPVRLIVGVGLAGGPEVLDALEGGLALLGRRPHGLDPHAHVDVLGLGLLDEVHHPDVGPVEEDRRRHVGDLHLLVVERHVDDTERGDGALVADLDRLLAERHAVRRARAAGRAVHLVAHGAPLAEDLALLDAAQEHRLGVPGDEPVAQLDRRVDLLDDVFGGGLALGHLLLLGHECLDVVDVADALVAPAGRDPHAGAHARLVAGVDDVQQRGVGAVEADERPGEGTVERVLLVRVGDPRPGGDLAVRADLDEVVDAELLAGLGVVLGGRADHVPVLGADAEEPAVAQAGHEPADDGADGPRVRVLEDVGRFEDVGLRHGQMRTRSRGASQTAVDSGGMTLQPDPREMYAFQDPAEDLARARKHELVREVKRLIDLTAHIDVERADRDELAQLADDAASLADRLEPLPSLLEVGGMAAQNGPQGALLERSGISGRANPLAPPMQWHPDGDVLRGWATYSPAYEGPIGNVHGGFVAAAFDDLMGMAQMASGSAGYTGTLTVKMLRPTPLNKRIDYEAGVERVDGRKIYVWAKSRDAATLLAEAQILFIAPEAGMPR